MTETSAIRNKLEHYKQANQSGSISFPQYCKDVDTLFVALDVRDRDIKTLQGAVHNGWSFLSLAHDNDKLEAENFRLQQEVELYRKTIRLIANESSCDGAGRTLSKINQLAYQALGDEETTKEAPRQELTSSESLDETGFEFCDDQGQLYKCRMWDDTPWLFRKQKRSGEWVSLKPVTQFDVWLYRSLATKEGESG